MPPVLVGAIAVLFCAVYVAINVKWNYGGNVTGLFYTAVQAPLPAEMETEPTWRTKDVKGYDAQFYHVMAHDPLILKNFEQYVDNPRLRWRRIFVPGLAAMIGGAGADIHWAYVAIEFGFLFLGTWWLSLYALSVGLHPLFGLAFLAVPAVLVSIDRMTVDLVLAALIVGLVLSKGPVPVYCILCIAPVVRESGMMLVVGWVAWSLWHRRWKSAVIGCLCALPALGWWAYVHSRTSVDGTGWMARYPFSGLIDRTMTIAKEPPGAGWMRAAGLAEYLALAGIWVAIGCGVWLVWRRRMGLMEVTAIGFVAFASLLGKYDIWDSAYATGRTMSPLLVLLVMMGLRDRQIIYFVPVLMILPRIALQYQAQVTMAIRGMSQ